MSLVASAHMRMKKKRSPRGATSPGGGGVVSPRSAYDDEMDEDIAHVGTVEESPVIVTLPEGIRPNTRASFDPSTRSPGGGGRPMPHSGGFGHGINALDSAGAYVVEGHHTAPYQQQHPHHAQPPRAPPSPPSNQRAPSPIDQYYQQARPPPSPIRDSHKSSVDQSFEAATRYQGNYTHNLLPRAQRAANKPRRRYDSFTGAPKDADDSDVVDDSSVAVDSADGQPQAFDPFAASASVSASPRSSPAFQNGPFPQQQFAGAPPSPGNRQVRMNPDMHVADNGAQRVSPQDPALATIEGNDNFVYDPEFEYHTEKDDGTTLDGAEDLVNESANGQDGDRGMIDDETVGTEQAQPGTPIKKKEHPSKKKKRRGHKSKIIIDNVDKADGHDIGSRGKDETVLTDGSVANGQYESDEDDNETSPREGEPHDETPRIGNIGSSDRRDLAAHAKRIATSGSDGTDGGMAASSRAGLPPKMPHGKKKAELIDADGVGGRPASSRKKDPFNGFANTATGRFSPQRLGASKSWDSHDNSARGINGLESTSFGSFSKNLMWEDDSSSNMAQKQPNAPRGGKTGAGAIGQAMRASKSWDEDGSAQQDGIATFGTWGDQTASLFDGQNATGAKGEARGLGGGEGSDKENLFEREDPFSSRQDVTDAKALAEWDKAEAQWRESVDVSAADEDMGDAPLRLAPKKPPPLLSTSKGASHRHHHPWDDPDGEQTTVNFASFDRSEFTGSALSGMKNRRNDTESAEEDDDSIFELGEARSGSRSALPDQEQPAKSIFSQINSGLKQADKVKKRSLGIQHIESDGSNDRSETSDVDWMAKEEELLKRVQDSPASETSASEKDHRRKGSISFATDAPRVHTYLVPEERAQSSMDGDTIEEVSLSEKIEDESTKARRGQKNQHRSRSLSPGGGDESLKSDADDNDTYGDSTLGDSYTYNSAKSGASAGKEGDLGFIEHVELGLTAVTASIGGLLGLGAAESQSKETEGGEKKGRDAAVRGNTDRGIATVQSVATEEERSIEADLENDTFESTLLSTQYTDTNTSGPSGRSGQNEENDWLGYVKNMIFPEDNVNDGESRDVGSSRYYEESTAYQEDEDNYLLQQALAAARAIHHVQGVEYDEKQEINVMNDIKFVVVTVSLPLGLLFQEHEIGVWVSRVVPKGNGHKTGVQHGDQLAAINGKSSVHMTIDEVASTISSTPSDAGVELTFLRYAGPLRPVPGSIIQEGFEVTDASVSPGRNAGKSMRNIFLRRSSKNTPPPSPGLSGRRFGLDMSPKSSKRGAAAQSQPTSKGSSKPSSTLAEAPAMPVINNGEKQKKKKKSFGVKLFKKKG